MKNKVVICDFVFLIIIMLVVILSFIGWVKNIIQVSNFHHITPFVIVKAIGIIVAPLGAVLGWF